MANARSARERRMLSSISGMMGSFYGELGEGFHSRGGDDEQLYRLASGDRKHCLARWFAREMGEKFAALTHNQNIWSIPICQPNQSKPFIPPVDGGEKARLAYDVGNLSLSNYAALTTVEIPQLDSGLIRVQDVVDLVPLQLQIGGNLCDAIGWNCNSVPRHWPSCLVPGTEWKDSGGRKFMPALTNDGIGWHLSMAPMDLQVSTGFRVLQQYKL